MSVEPALGNQMVKGATWMIFQRMTVRVIGLVSTIVLARLLFPDDFGLVALATGIAAIVDSLLELGFDLALIQNQSDGRTRYNTAWTLTILRGLITAAALVAAAHPLAILYEDPRLFGVMLWLALAALISGFINISIVEFRKEMRFDREFTLLVWAKMAGFVTTLTLAWILRDYRALVAGILVGKVTMVILSYAMHSYRPRLSLEGARGFLHFSAWLCLDNIVTIIKTRLDTFIIGKIAGTSALGFYSVAYEISNLTMTELTSPISRVLFAGFSKISGDARRLARSFLDSFSVIAFLGMPIAVGIALTAYQIVAIFLGERWLPIVPLIQILTLYGLLNLPTANTGAFYLAMGRTDLFFWRNVPSVIVLVPGLIIGAQRHGTEGAAWALVASAAVNFVVNFWMIRKQAGIRLRDIAAVSWRPAVATAIMFVAVMMTERQWPAGEGMLHLVLQLFSFAACGTAVYLVTVLLLWQIVGRPDGIEARVIEMARAKLESRRAGSLSAAAVRAADDL
jgi:PST family polysaccharide transporter